MDRRIAAPLIMVGLFFLIWDSPSGSGLFFLAPAFIAVGVGIAAGSGRRQPTE